MAVEESVRRTVKTLSLRLNYIWRLFATGFCFLTFALMGLSFRFVVCPLLDVFVRDGRQRELAARRVVQKSFSLFVGLMQSLRCLECRFEGDLERLRSEPLLICANHPTLIDVVLLMSKIPNATCIVKSALTHSFALKAPVLTSGYISNDSGPELIEDCIQAVKKKDTLIIFPEGTRTRPGIEPRLKHGAAAAAIAARANITPIVISCTPPSLMKGMAWYSIPSRKMSFSVKILPDIDVNPYVEAQASIGRPAAVRRLNQTIKETLFAHQEASNGQASSRTRAQGAHHLQSGS